MWKVIFGAFLGAVIGCTFGIGLMLFMVLIEPRPDDRWNSNPMFERSGHVQFAFDLFSGMLHGGGFGALIGSIAGATNAICQAIENLGQSPKPGKE